jgi:hypothetical protein
VVPALRRRVALLAGAGALLVVAGCSSLQEPEVQRVATTFENGSADPEARCDLLVPATRAALEKQAGTACSEAIGSLQLAGGGVKAVEVWGGQAQIRLAGDTLFLNQTSNGWRVSAAGCTPNGQAPYDCEVQGP